MTDSALFLVAHPDDEALGFAGAIWSAREAGRRVRVVVATNGDSEMPGRALPIAGARAGTPARTLRYGRRRVAETVAAMSELGLHWHPDVARSDVLFLGYRNNGLADLADGAPSLDPTGLNRTYAGDPRRFRIGCSADLAARTIGRHSRLTRVDFDADLDRLLDLSEPVEIYTHAEFDGHPDHAALYRLLAETLERREATVAVRTTLIHPAGSGSRMYESALEWPNPGQVGHEPGMRFRPDLCFEPPPTPAGPDWGPLGPPDERVAVPVPMRTDDPIRNLKWRAIRRYVSQLHCDPDRQGRFHPACGYLRSFVKRDEFFWLHPFAGGVDRRRAAPVLRLV